MAEQEIKLPVSFPEPHVASKFAMTVSLPEFQLAIGHMRMGYSPDGNAASSVVEYHGAYSISPSAAKQLAQILVVGVRQYEDLYGPIPQDASVAEKLAAGGDRSIVQGGKIIPIKSPSPKKAPAKKR
ncbi:hypothetical protein [Polaromonas sp.]|uniref:hypothetical protein n=1 Tax=Polaromonas sp. TaxID=1869339 RepID=UPI003BAC7BC7